MTRTAGLSHITHCLQHPLGNLLWTLKKMNSCVYMSLSFGQWSIKKENDLHLCPITPVVLANSAGACSFVCHSPCILEFGLWPWQHLLPLWTDHPMVNCLVHCQIAGDKRTLSGFHIIAFLLCPYSGCWRLLIFIYIYIYENAWLFTSRVNRVTNYLPYSGGRTLSFEDRQVEELTV